MKQLLSYLANIIVDAKEQFEVNESQDENGSISLNLYVDPSQIGKVIGKNGQTVRALKNLLRVKAMQLNQHFFLTVEPMTPKG